MSLSLLLALRSWELFAFPNIFVPFSPIGGIFDSPGLLKFEDFSINFIRIHFMTPKKIHIFFKVELFLFCMCEYTVRKIYQDSQKNLMSS